MLFCWGISHYLYHYKEVHAPPPRPPAGKQNCRVIFRLDIGTETTQMAVILELSALCSINAHNHVTPEKVHS